MIGAFGTDPEFGDEFGGSGDVEGKRDGGHRARGNGQEHGPSVGERKTVETGGEFGKLIRGRRGECGARDEVGGVVERDAGDKLAGAEEAALQFGHACRGDEIAWDETVAPTEGSGETDGLAAVGAGGHDAGGAERDVGRAGDTASEEEIGEVARVEAAIGNQENAFRVPLLATGLWAVDAGGRVEVDRPTAEGNGVGLGALLDEVALGNHKISSKRRLSRLPGMVPTHSRVRLAASGNLPEFLM